MVGGTLTAVAGGAVELFARARSSGSAVKMSVRPTAGGAVVLLGGAY